ncbi:MAG: RHS repeat protein [Candidatus Eremiobacteraeota bacterium]|nr:RHS repeat protein [Candidatus Eremiobacteraeota bacterium]
MRFRVRAALAALLSFALLSQVSPVSLIIDAITARPLFGGIPLAAAATLWPQRVPVAPATPPRRIPVKEPARVKPSPFSLSALRPKTVHGVRAHGIPVNGPPMLRPFEVDHAMTAIRRRAMQQRSLQLNTRASPPRALPLPAPPRTRPGTRRAMSLPSDPTASGTGINHWWRYQEENVPGGGHLMVNVGTGNLLLQDDDMAVPHKGIAMAFRRTYNSQSPTTVSGDLQTWTGLYGNGWTNTFDAHVIRTSPGHFSVYDIDGARYDYITYGGYTVSAPPGDHSTLTWDGACGLLWQKKSGTLYYFYNVDPSQSCSTTSGTVGGYAGRIHQIIGRNRNTSITFNYSWDTGDASVTGKISGITATTESGMSATLAFADFNGHRLLQQLTFPDGGTSVIYGYDANGNLASVERPPNNSAGTRPLQTFSYQPLGSDWVLADLSSPRYNAGCTAGSCGSDGEGLLLGYTGTSAVSSTVSSIEHVGVVNPTISDAVTSGPLQSGFPATAYGYLTEFYTTGVPTPTYRDTDGHMTNWVVDGLGRPTQTQECTASTSQGQQCSDWSRALVTNETWDANNNLTSEMNPRGYQTDYAYDTNGNTVAVAEPSTTVITPTGTATFRPTQLYDYDQFNNVIAYCDQRASHPSGDWTAAGPPTAGGPDALCANNGSSAHAVFTYPVNPAPSYEPYGELTNIRTPMGYNRAIGYDPARQGGVDYGLPTSVAGDPISQPDGMRTPLESLTYDTSGNLICSMGDGNDPTTTTVLSYDALNRVVAIGDPDDTSLPYGSCAKTPGIPLSTIVTRKTYFPDGTLATTQNPSEFAAGVSTQFQYDLDGNETVEITNHTSTPATTHKWYDGADRLIEVQQPPDPNSDFYYPVPWSTRYLYDLTAGGNVHVGTSPSYQAYGNLFETQEYLPASGTPTWAETGSTGNTNFSWQDTAGTTFDALDRATVQYRDSSIGMMPVTNTYDGAGSAGLLSQTCNAKPECRNFSYNERGLKYQATFNPTSTTAQTFMYDDDGRLASAQNGVGSIADAYDADGRKSTRMEAVGSNTPATLTYGYYADGLRSAISISGLANMPNVLGYSYRADNLVRKVTLPGNAFLSFAYTGGRRPTSRGDSTGQAPDTISYGPSGLPLSESMPAWQESGMTYNAEGEQLGGSTQVFNNGAWIAGSTLAATYSTRGEIVTELYPSDDKSAVPAKMANGVRIIQVRSIGVSPPRFPATGSYQFDAKQSFPVGNSTANTCGEATVHCTDNGTGTLQNNTTTQFQYDTVGRQVGQLDYSEDAQLQWQESTKVYDAEDHLLVDNRPNETLYTGGKANSPVEFSLGYVWGPTNHPFQIGSTSIGNGITTPTDFQYDALYWDDDTLLFTVNPSGAIDDIKIGDLADYVPGASNPLTVWDRTHDDEVIGCHNATGSAAALTNTFNRVILDCRLATKSFTSPHYASPVATVGRGALLTIAKGDGIGDGYNTVQGVRTFDPQAGVWNTPDAYHGDVHDPMTQKPYMWNRNNPYVYSDPSGYCWGPLIVFCYEMLMGGAVVTAEASAPGLGGAVGPVGLASRTLVIGKLADLEAPGAIGAGERTLLGMADRGTPKLNWKQNFSLLRSAMRSGRPIRDASVNADGSLRDNTGFTRMERNALQNAGWHYDQATQHWLAPDPVPAPAPGPGPEVRR